MENQPKNQSKHKLLSWVAVATAGALALLTLMPELFDLYSESEQKEEPRTDVTKPSLAVSAHEPLPIEFTGNSSSTISLTLNTTALLALSEITYIDPYTRASLLFKRSNTIKNSNSETVVGSVYVNGMTQPMTITISGTEVFASIPLESGYYSGSGSTTNIILVKNKPISDRIVQELPSKQSPATAPLKEITRECLNCD
jgi:hypothetical protein